ncbi:NAD(P)/FAD-dependent oxidoreductase [Solidesulfovibrio sp.]|uniref:NAD(P)/FAD-dependent oxidoreductase n=1 Tax=Solidesulfovibrio sp. TaxID=2910990 RepID=UPI000EDEAEEF|nr:FAD-dependent oxidoreductase [Solidesulfovibrio sp.]MEA5088880.1 FAD-dependent oxidoreductase [Solidesulfovibrio sp.]HCR12003.1 FAD-dependent oxidoreductase [Desulfovibrio sp.]HML60154.1 FAD-dependent oxidoreductase [Solidesulfovibrio sp.]
MPHDSRTDFDVIIVGGGPAGLFAAYRLSERQGLRVLLLEKGKAAGKRRCPMHGQADCRKCKPCNILSGIGGAGLFSDGKLNFIPRLGKTDLTQFMPLSEAVALIDETEALFTALGMDGPVYPTDIERARALRKEARKCGIELLLIRQKHLGSDRLPDHIAGMSRILEERGVTIRTGEEARDVLVRDGRVAGVATQKGSYAAPAVILAPGRVGAEWMGALARRHGLPYSQRGIEVGVRVEVHNEILSDLTDVIYDPTFFVRTRKYDDQTRTFCTNQGGYVALENYQDFVCVNGHAYMDAKSDSANFAFLSKVVLTDPVSDNQAYGEAIGRLATMIGGGNPILQRFGDLKRGRRSTWSRIRRGSVEPTLTSVTCGDIAMALPERIVANLVDGLEQLNAVVPGVANDETLLYAPEIKFFATQIDATPELETAIPGMFVAGDGPGVAGNIVSAAATGLIPAKAILRRL